MRCTIVFWATRIVWRKYALFATTKNSKTPFIKISPIVRNFSQNQMSENASASSRTEETGPSSIADRNNTEGTCRPHTTRTTKRIKGNQLPRPPCRSHINFTHVDNSEETLASLNDTTLDAMMQHCPPHDWLNEDDAPAQSAAPNAHPQCDP